jgi:hypothetical protein
MNDKMKKNIFAGLVCGLFITGAVLWTGCDTASADEELVLSPSSVILSAGQSQLFTVTGGYHYNWYLTGESSSTNSTSTAQGSLSSLTGSEVRYFAPSGVTAGDTVTVWVKSTIQGSGSSSSNSPDYEVIGKAIVTFK